MSEPREGVPPPLRLRIEKPIYGGAGLGRDEGKAIFVPYTLAGELVSVSVTHSKASFAEATLNRIDEPSPERVDPLCPYFGVCGGCHYQHASYAAQLAMKAAILEETLARARLAPLPKIATHAGAPFAYRNRVRLHLDALAKTPGTLLGYRMRGSHSLVPIERCPIAAPALEAALNAFAGVCASQQHGNYFTQVELSVNHDATELLMALWPRAGAMIEEAGERLARLCETLEAELPMLRGACVHAPAPAFHALPQVRSRQPRHGWAATHSQANKAGGREPDEPGSESAAGVPIARWGASEMTYRVAGLDYRVSLGSFFQVNRTLLDELVHLATDGRSGMLAWDLYAGVGLFSRVLAHQFERVVAVESAPISADDLRFHLAEPHQAVRSSTVEFLRREARSRPIHGSAIPQEKRAPDFVLVDPPRAGLGEEVTSLLAQIGPPEITYVSCDPATLSRDLRALVDSGYKLQQLHLIDLFPQTFHLETVVMLSRR